MEGGNKVPINLAAGLDISSSDMIVRFNAQTFQHNWQKWQGKYLPNSLRYEHNGWAAGWNVYDFEYNPFTVKFEDEYSVGVEKLASNIYMASLYHDDEELLKPLQDWRVVTKSEILSGAVTLEKDISGKDAVVGVVNGFEGNDKYYKLIWNPLSKKFTESNPHAGYVIKEQTVKDGIVTVDVVNAEDSFNGKLALFVATALNSKYSQAIPYSGFTDKGRVHTWGGYTLNLRSDTLTTPSGKVLNLFEEHDGCKANIRDGHILEFQYNEIVKNSINSFDNFFDFNDMRFINTALSVSYGNDKVFNGEMYTLSLSLDRFYKGFLDVSGGIDGVSTDAQGRFSISSSARDVDFNKMSVSCNKSELLPNSRDSNNEPIDNSLIVDITVPIWCTIGLERVGTSDTYEYVVRHHGVDVTERYDIGKTTDPDRSNWHLDSVQYNVGYHSSHVRWTWSPWEHDNWATLTANDKLYVTAKQGEKNTFITDAVFGYFNARDSIPASNSRTMKLHNDGLVAWFNGKQIDAANPMPGMDYDHDRDGNNYFDFWHHCSFSFTPQLKSKDIKHEMLGQFAYAEYGKDVQTVMQDNRFIDVVSDPVSGKLLNGQWYKDSVVLEQTDTLEYTDSNDTQHYGYFKTGSIAVPSILVYTDAVYEDGVTKPITKELLDAGDCYCYVYDQANDNQNPPVDLIDTQAIDKKYVKVVEGGYNAYRSSNSWAEPRYVYNDKLYDIPMDNAFLDDRENICVYIYSEGEVSLPSNSISSNGKFYANSNGDVVALDAGYFSNNELKEEYRDAYTQLNVTKVVNPDSTGDVRTCVVDKRTVACGDLEADGFTRSASGSIVGLQYKYCGAVVMKGHMLLKLTYRQIGSSQDLMDDTKGLLAVSPVPSDSKIFENYVNDLQEDTKYIFIDREADEAFNNAIGDKKVVAEYLFKAKYSGSMIDDYRDGGNISIKILPVSSEVWPFIFGVKNNDQSSTSTVVYNHYLPDFSPLDIFERATALRFGDSVPSQGQHANHTTVTSNTKTCSLEFNINWRPDFVTAPVKIAATLRVLNRGNYTHNIYTKEFIKLQSAICNVGQVSGQKSGVDFTVSVPSVSSDNSNSYITAAFNFDFMSQDITLEQFYSNGDTLYSAEDGTVKFDSDFLNHKVGKGSQAFLPLELLLQFKDCAASFVASAEDVDSTSEKHLLLVDCVDGDVVRMIDTDEEDLLDSGDAESQKHILSYSMLRRRFIDSMITVNNVAFDRDEHRQDIEYSLEYKERFSATMRAVYGDNSSKFNDNAGSVDFTYDSRSFSVQENDMTSHNYDVVPVSYDIREPNKKTLGNISPEGQLQLLKQAWNTTDDVENYWWVDRNHLLELGPRYFVLKRNTKRLHDWNGDIFEDVWRIPRADVIKGNVYRYFVSSAFKRAAAVFWTVEQVTGGILVSVYDVRKKFKKLYSFTIYVRHKNLGEPLHGTTGELMYGDDCVYFNTYSQLTPEAVLSKAEWSSTIVNNRLIIGCHVSNNFNQWAIVVDLNVIDNNTDASPIDRVIQGYGYVGLHGELTGGMIPVEFFNCNAYGFTGTVEPLSVLDKQSSIDKYNVDSTFEVTSEYDINDIKTHVVGTAEQQWYIKKRLHGIVSHIEYIDDPKYDDGYEFVPRVIPITNNYEALHASPSFYSSVIGDCMVQVSALYDLLKFPSGMNTVWRTFCGFIGYPLLYNLAPRFSSIVYLQQSLGQYAYVHYNSSRSMPESEAADKRDNKKDVEPTLSSEYIFDKQKVMQHANISLDYFTSGIIALLMSAFSEAIDVIEKKQSVNEEQNTGTFTDKSKQFIENVVENTGNMLASSIITQSKTDMGLTSTVTGLKSLDMFYSTSDSQRVFAGPGFVEAQFVADCIAQSVTDTQVEGRVTQLFYNIRGLTVMQTQMLIKLESLIADKFSDMAERTSKTVVGSMPGPVTTPGVIPALVFDGIATTIRIAISAQQICLEQVEKVLDSLARTGLKASTDSQVSRHALSVEGKHKYGEKNEVFMWPCWGVPAGQLKYSDETVACGVKNTPWELALHASKYYTSVQTNWANIIVSQGVPNMSGNKASITQMSRVGSDGSYTGSDGDRGVSDIAGDNYRAYRHEGKVPFYQIAPYGEVIERTLPDDMAKIEGVSRFLPSTPFRNENIAVSDPAFAPSLIHDYIIDKDWQLGICASYGLRQWVTVRDTKIINGAPSNIVVDGEFCGIASPYTAVELKRGIKKAYMRPLAITPNALALNCTGYNTLYDDQLYHSFDGMSCRFIDLVGSPGLNKNRQSFYYAIQVNDRFKRSNIIPAQEMQGNFETEPVIAMNTIDKLWTTLTVASKEKGLEAGTVGEDKDAVRWAIPVFTEPVSTLPACVKTLTATTLAVVEGVTGLVTAQVTDTNSAYKAPTSVDFSIGRNVYRATEEYICSVTPADGGNIIKEIIPTLGLKFIGSTPTEAYFYSKATRCYYVFTGSTLVKVDMMERFRDIQRGYWDFVNQEVVMPCLMTFKRLNAEVEDKDTETDNVIVPVLANGQVSGELPPPLTTIFNDRSWYKCLSLPSGFAYQGPNRVIINRAVFTEYMLDGIKRNLGSWKKVPRERYSFNREYGEKYDTVNNTVNENGAKGVAGWTHNPFLLVTSAFGLNENVDCIFEWEVAFCWPVEMDLIYGQDNYATVNILAETMTPGGKQESRPTHVFLTKELFTRNGNYGYYSFRFQSKNGSGNRERLKIWSDQYIAVSSVTCEYKVVTQRRTEQLTQQVDVSNMQEL